MSNNRLTLSKAFDLHMYLVRKEDQLKAKWEPLAKISAKASASLGFYVSEDNLRGALKTAGITRCERPKAAGGEDPNGQALERIESHIATIAATMDAACRAIAISVKDALERTGHLIPAELNAFLDSTPQTTGTDSTDEPAKT